MRLTLLLMPFALAGPAAAEPTPPACLRAVHFADAREGWAAGDHGLILRTIDGGRTWERQPGGSRASLTGLAFPSPYVGYAVGRTELATGGSVGTVLRTDDAGVTWRECNGTGLPGLNCVQFFDESTGFAAGDSTPSFPASVYRTGDGGRTWDAIPGPRVGRVVGLTCPDATTGVFASDRGPLLLRDGRLDPLPATPGPACAATACARLGDATTIATATGELLRHDGTWTRAALAPLGTVHALAAGGPAALAVGRLGGVALRSTDGFRTHVAARLPTPVPLHAVTMVDAKCGWAVGELGTVVATTDGGTTWRLQRAGGQRAAILFIHADARDLPCPLVARLAQLGGYHCVAALTEAGDPTRLAAAIAQLGGAGADCADATAIPHFLRLAPPDAAADAARLERLVVALKIWRPEVVVTDPAGDTPLTRAALERMTKATRLAADAAAYPGHAALGLAPHAVAKLMTVDTAGTTAIDCSPFEPELGESLAHYAEPAAQLLPGSPLAPDVVKLSTVVGPPGDPAAGLALAPGGTARADATPRDPDAAWLRARRGWHADRVELERLAALGTPESRGELLAKLGKLPAPVLARAGVALAQVALARDASFARELYQLVADRAGLETPSAIALHWLARNGASSELTRRTELGAFAAPPTGIWEPVPEPAVRGAAALAPSPRFRLRDPETARDYYLAATEGPARLAAFGPAATRDPLAHLAADAARRKLGREGDARANLLSLLAADPCDPVGNPLKLRVAEEARLLTPDGVHNPAAPRLSCQTGPAPYLDGKLDEAAWRAAPAAVLALWTTGVAGDRYPTRVRSFTDGQFLYLGFTADGAPKPLTPTVDGQDRVELLLDLDRDYSSYCRVRVAANGQSDCDCAGDRAWRSGHFAAVSKTERGWSAEVAIPLASLTGGSAWGEVWCFNAVRVVPGVAAGGWASQSDGAPDATAMGHLRMPPKPAAAKATVSPK